MQKWGPLPTPPFVLMPPLSLSLSLHTLQPLKLFFLFALQIHLIFLKVKHNGSLPINILSSYSCCVYNLHQ